MYNKKGEEDKKEHQFKEGDWGWIVVIASAYCFGLTIGYINIYSLIYNEFVIVYNSTENHVVYSAWIGSTANGVQYAFCIVSSMLVDLFGSRKIGIAGGLLSTIGLLTSGFIRDIRLYFVTYGVVFGSGQSLLLAALLAILPHYFQKRLGVATGLMNFGGAFLTISLPFVVSQSLSSIKLANTFFVLAAFAFVSVILSITFIPQIETDTKINWKKRVKNSLGIEVLKRKKFIIWVMAGFIGSFGYLIPIVTISHHVVITFPENFNYPALLAAILGAFSGLSGVIFGRISDYVNITPVYFHILSFLIGGIIQIVIQFAKTILQLGVLIALYGIIDGLFLSFILPISVEVADSHTLSTQATGFFFGIISIPTIVGPTIAGLIFEKFGSYSLAFYIGGSSCILAAFFLLILYPRSFVRVLSYKLVGKYKEKMENKKQTYEVEISRL